MKREFLQNLKVNDQPLSKEIIDAIMAENGRDIEAAKKPFADFDHLKEQLEEAQKTIKSLRDQDIEGVRKTAKDWEEKYNQAVKDHEAQLANMAFDRKIEDAIAGAKGRNAKAIKALLDVEALKGSKNQDGRTVLHYCKYVNDVVLFATENKTEPELDGEGNIIREPMAKTGWYDHGLYPFVFDPLFKTEGTPCGFGFIDLAKSTQEYIDRGDQAIMKNFLANVKPRHFIRKDGAVNEEEYADMDKDFVHVDGNLGQDSILPIQGKTLSDIYVQVINNKVDELKETTGNRDISTGGTTSGVTAAAAIAAMQEAGSKLSRDNIKSAYRAFRKVCRLCMELIRQFYNETRCFRIMGENGAHRYIQYKNTGLRPQHQGVEHGVDLGYRVPMFDIEITAQKQSPYSKMSQNELALQFFGAGFFNPQMADQALACLDMMDFDRKQFVMSKIAQNGTMYQQLLMAQQTMLQLAKIVDQAKGTNLAEQIAAGITTGTPVAPMLGSGGLEAARNVGKTEALGGESGSAEASSTKKARQRVAESTSPV